MMLFNYFLGGFACGAIAVLVGVMLVDTIADRRRRRAHLETMKRLNEILRTGTLYIAGSFDRSCLKEFD